MASKHGGSAFLGFRSDRFSLFLVHSQIRGLGIINVFVILAVAMMIAKPCVRACLRACMCV
eukprot:SAG22_NODE_385_length_11304_cov_21.304775_5_plen_61_part_00